jgi:hypothetical protein
MKDKELQTAINEMEVVENLVASEGWKRAKKILLEKIVQLDSLSGIDKSKPPAEVVAEMAAREGAIALIFEWLREIEGKASQAKSTKEILMNSKRDEILVNIE